MFARRSAVVIGSAAFVSVVGVVSDVYARGRHEVRPLNKSVAHQVSNMAADGCKPLDTPSRLPAVNSLFDSAALVLNLKTADPSFKRKLIISIGLTNTPAAGVVEGGDASPAVDSMLRVVIDALRLTAADSTQAFHVVIQGGTPLKVKIERSEICAPQLLSGAETSAPERVPIRTGRVVSKTPNNRPPPGMSASAMRSPGNPKVSMPRLRIDANGLVIDVKPDGKDGEVDEETRVSWMGRKFAAATVDGVAVEVWYNGSKTELVARAK